MALRFASFAITAAVALAASRPSLFSPCRKSCMAALYNGDHESLVGLLDANTNKMTIVCDDTNCPDGDFCNYDKLGASCRLCSNDQNIECATGNCFGAAGVASTQMNDTLKATVPNCGGLADATLAYQYQDMDMDGLSDAQEKELTTSPTNADTDGDNMSDGDELNINWAGDGEAARYTDPKNGDTDGDGIPDGEEYIGRYIISNLNICSQVYQDHHDLLDGQTVINNVQVWHTYSAPNIDQGIKKKGCYMSSDPTLTLSIEALALRTGLSTDSEAVQDYRTQADTLAAEQGVKTTTSATSSSDYVPAPAPGTHTPGDSSPSPSVTKTPSPATKKSDTSGSGSGSSSSSSGLSGGAIAGIAVGVMAGVALGVGGYSYHKNRKMGRKGVDSSV